MGLIALSLPSGFFFVVVSYEDYKRYIQGSELQKIAIMVVEMKNPTFYGSVGRSNAQYEGTW